MSGLGIPTYVVDSPHGGGKIPLMPNYLVSASDDAVVLRNYEGMLVRYQAEDKPNTARADDDPRRQRALARHAIGAHARRERADGPTRSARARQRTLRWRLQHSAATSRMDDGTPAEMPVPVRRRKRARVRGSLLPSPRFGKRGWRDEGFGAATQTPPPLPPHSETVEGESVRIGIAFDLKPKTPIPAGARTICTKSSTAPPPSRRSPSPFAKSGHTPIELGNGREFLLKLLNDPPDLVFNLAEGTGTSRNREARVPAVCEMLGIPHTGSDVLTLALCLDKDMCRRTVQDAEVVVPNGLVLSFQDGEYDGDFHEFAGLVAETGLALPLIAKPVCEGSSKGIRSKCLIERPEDVGPVVVSLWNDYKQAVLVEEFIAGDEVTVGVVGNDPPRVLGCMRVVPKQPTDRFLYCLEVKRDWEARVSYECPAKLPPATMTAIENAALAAYDILGCRDVTRIDFRVRDGVPYFLEANPLPGLNPDTGDLLLICKAMGLSHADLIATIVNEAAARHGM